MKKNTILLAVGLLLLGCNPNYDMPGMFNGTSPEIATRFAESTEYNARAGEIHLSVPADYRIYVCTDSHIDSTHNNLEQFVLAYKSDSLCPFAIHLGDLINAQGNYPHAYQTLQAEPAVAHHDTLFITPGNHDIYFNQWTEYRNYFKTSAYWFDTRNEADGQLLDLFICLDSAEGTLGTEQMKWLRNLLETKQKEGYRHIIVFTHTHPFKQDNSQGHTSNYAMEETYELTYTLSKYGVDMYWCGHDHHREITHFGNTEYIIVNTCRDPEEKAFYMLVDMGKQIHYQFVPLN